MKMQEIKDILRNKILIDRLELDEDELDDINDNDDLFDEDGLDLDSVESLDIITGISEEFDIDTSSLTQKEITDFHTINQIAEYVLNKVGEK